LPPIVSISASLPMVNMLVVVRPPGKCCIQVKSFPFCTTSVTILQFLPISTLSLERP